MSQPPCHPLVETIEKLTQDLDTIEEQLQALQTSECDLHSKHSLKKLCRTYLLCGCTASSLTLGPEDAI